jgi:L-2-hydroxyglutarate oxidase LhgO
MHAGIYYAAGSLRALTCVAGRESLLRYCEVHDISNRLCGKLIVAGSATQPLRLEALLEQACRNGVNDLEWLNELRRTEPVPAAHAALFSPGSDIHMTLDLAGRARIGPDVEWVNVIDYPVDPRRAPQFYAAIREYWPGLRDGQLSAAYAGIRPKLIASGEADCDFRLCGPAVMAWPVWSTFSASSCPG